jgi:ribonuclease R
VIQTMMLRSLSQAVYQPENEGHFGLHYAAYAHFTSPIRRYPDLLVHRGIRSLIRSEKAAEHVQRIEGTPPIPARRIFPYDTQAMAVHGEHCSLTERRADDATREVQAWLKCEYLLEHVGDAFDGVISAVTSFGLFVELVDIYIEGLVHVTALPGDYYNFDASHQRLTGERTGRSFQLGGKVRVQVARVDLDDRKIDLELLEAAPPRKAKKAGKSGGGKSKRHARGGASGEGKGKTTGKGKRKSGDGKGQGKGGKAGKRKTGLRRQH